MFRFKKQLAVLFALLFIGTVCLENTYAQKRRSGGSSFGRSSGSKYSSGSRKSSGSKYSSGSKSGSSQKSKYSSGSKSGSSQKSKYSSGSSKSNTGQSKYSSGSNKSSTGQSKSKYSSGTSSGTSSGSSKNRPPASSSNSKTRANQAATSKRKYEETKRATAPPKSSYRTADGKEVKVRTSSSHVKNIRSKPSTYYTPQARQQRVTTHISVHNYSHPSSWYYSQPNYYVGGGYSSAFWWMMMEWSAERRARWLYHNQHTIESAAYQRGLQDAEVAAKIQELEAQNLQRNSDYVDPEFSDNPDMMYSQDYVEAAYNPTVISSGGSEAALTILIWIIIIGVVAYAVYLLATRLRFGS